MTNPIVDVEGERASCRMQMQATHFFRNGDQEEFSIGGYYEDKLLHNGEQWLISAVILKIFWRRGVQDIMAAATRKGQTILESNN